MPASATVAEISHNGELISMWPSHGEKPGKHTASHFLARTLLKLDVMMHTLNPSTGEANTGGFL